MGGGMFHYNSRVIAIDPDWPFKGNELLLTLEHEYGHALFDRAAGLEAAWALVDPIVETWRSGKPVFRKGWSARAKVNGRIGRMHGLRIVRTPPR